MTKKWKNHFYFFPENHLHFSKIIHLLKKLFSDHFLAKEELISRALLSPVLNNHPFWQKLTGLFNSWTNPASLLHRKLDVIWFEFDHEGTPYNLVRNLFFSIKPNENDSGNAVWENIRSVLDEIYWHLFGIPFPASLSGTLERCIFSLPDNARILQIRGL